MPRSFEVTPGAEWAAAVKRLRSADKVIRTELNKEIRQITAPIVRDMRREIMSMESSATGMSGGAKGRARVAVERSSNRAKARETAGRKLQSDGFSLRKTIAQSLRTKITYSGRTQGVRIRVDPTKLGRAGRKLPKNIDKGQWRHPVFGDRENWVVQTVKPGWFTGVAQRYQAQARSDIMQAMARSLKKIEG